MKIKAIITGATGMVGEGVMHECLHHSDVSTVLLISRREGNVQHPKLKEIVHEDFTDFSSLENELSGYNAAFLCMGVSSLGMSEAKYAHITYDLTMALARTLSKLNPEMSLCHVSGVGTDSSGKSRTMWARVKGKTENDLLKLPFKQAYMLRPGIILPTKGLKNTNTFYKIANPLFPVFRLLFPKYIASLKEIGLAMINSVNNGYNNPILEVKDIIKLAK